MKVSWESHESDIEVILPPFLGFAKKFYVL